MSAQENTPSGSANRLLASLPPEDWNQLRSCFTRVRLELFQGLYEFKQTIPYVYFPTSSILSMLLKDGEDSVEVAIAGNEGMLGLTAALGVDCSPSSAICQMAGEALRMKASTFREFVQRSEAIRERMHRYAAYLLLQSFQSTACNRLHTAEQRICRWLLMTHDRAGTSSFPMTHDFLSRMLGVRRPTVSLAAKAIQQSDLIRYNRGQVTILNRQGLESASCPCYGIVRKEEERLGGNS